jgi:hypothetical protein
MGAAEDGNAGIPHRRLSFVAGLPRVEGVELQPFHRHETAKSTGLGREYAFEEVESLKPEDLRDIETLGRSLGQPMFGKYKNEQGCSIRGYQAMLQEYYEARGWDLQTGAPTQYTLKRLGLRKFHDRL